MGLFKRYTNPHIKQIKRTPRYFLAWLLGFYNDKSKEKVIPKDFSYPLSSCNKDIRHKATYINHSTYLIEALGCTFLTDPIWSKRCSPVSFFGPKRLHAPGVEIKDLKSLDYVLISHNHYDHLDLSTIRALYSRFPNLTFVVPVGLKKWFLKRGIDQVVELNWWQSMSFCVEKNAPKIQITAVPSQHHSGRGLFDANRSLWAGFVVTIKHQTEKKCFYFVGDTAYNDYDFKKIGARFKDIDLSLCPIGTYLPEKFMETVHLSPKGAVAIHRDVNSKLTLGMHWGTFCLSEEPLDAPPYDLYNEMSARDMDPQSFLPIPPGYTVNW